MLQRLYIRNFAVVEEVSIEFGGGLNVLTGETGAGKSILVDAIASLLGTRLSPDLVRRGTKTAVIEVVFGLNDEQIAILNAALAEQEITVSSDQLTIRRELTATGRARALINEHVVGVGVLKTIVPGMIDLSMQGEQYALNAPRNQLTLLDQYAGCAQTRKHVESLYHRRLKSLHALSDLRAKLAEGRRARDFVEFQLAEIVKVDPAVDEDETLTAERLVLANQDKISSLEREIYQTLYEDEGSITTQLNAVRKQLSSLVALDASYVEHLTQIEAAKTFVTDVAEGVFAIHNSRTWSEDRLEQVESRLFDIERLKRKHGGSLSCVLTAKNDLQNTLEHVDSGIDREAEAIAELKRIEDEYLHSAKELSAARRRAAKSFGSAVTKGLRSLALPDAKFVVEVKDLRSREATQDVDTSLGGWSPTGLDRVEFLFSANRGADLRSLAQVASGGEMSRVSLIVQSVCSTLR